MTTTTEAPKTRTERVVDPIHKTSYEFEREGENLWVYSRFEPGAHLPEHYHPVQVERWEALDGVARLRLDGKWRDLRPEDGPVTVEPGVRHELKNESGKEIRLRTEVVPAGRLLEFLTESAQAAREGYFNARNLPTGLRGALWLAQFANEFREETVMTSPPPALQRLVLPPAAWIASRLKPRAELLS